MYLQTTREIFDVPIQLRTKGYTQQNSRPAGSVHK